MADVASFSTTLDGGKSKDVSVTKVQNAESPSSETSPHSSALEHLPVVQPKAIPQGSPGFEEKRSALLQAFAVKVPLEYRLPTELIKSPPIDVSGIPVSCGILSAEELEITEDYDAVSLSEALASRKYTAVTVAKAFAKRAIIAHQVTCCLTQWFMDEAIAQAQKLDDYLAEHGRPIGPLHGLPVSIKEHMAMAGRSSSQGWFGSITQDNEDSDMVAILRSLGAVFYCKTNQPQLIMHLETTSFWGRTLNPFNIHLSAGGSTGGEAALIAMKGSVLGVGTDIGGSIRGPSTFCGIYGYKTTSYILPMKGFLQAPFAAELNVLCSTGPMCRSLRDMDFFMKCVLSTKPYLSDPSLIPTPWTGLRTQLGKRLKIGIIRNDGFVTPQPPVQRALSWAVEKLGGTQYEDIIEIKDFIVYGATDAWSMIRKIYWPDGGEVTQNAIRATGEPVHSLTEWIQQDAKPSGMQNAQDVNLMRRQRDEFRSAFAKNWGNQDVDVVLGPGYVGPACAHDTAFYWTYTSLFNFVDYPGAVFPTPIKTEVGEMYNAAYKPLSDACQHVKQLWESTDFRGSPVNLQLVARRYHDNELFAALEVLKDILDLP